MTQLDAIFNRSSDSATDPVCKMTVSKANPRGGTAEHNGETYFFCSPGCRSAFLEDPEKYLSADSPADHGHMGHDRSESWPFSWFARLPAICE
jgi:YHS domain-containing protein